MIYEQETIHIDNLRVDCIIGVNPEERVHAQPLLVSLSFPWSFAAAAAAEDLHATVNYSAVAERVRVFVQQGRFELLETLARGLAAHLCEHFDLAELRLHVRKPNVVADSDGPAVSLTARRGRGPHA